jgi:hypothetical protein
MLLHKFTWCIHQPGHGHFLEQSRDMAVPAYSLAIAAESNAEARGTLQTKYAVPVIVEKLSDLHRHCTTCKLPNLDGYYGRVVEPDDDRLSGAQQAKLHSDIIAIMKQRVNLKIVALELHKPCHQNLMAELTKSLQQQGWKLEVRKIHSAEHFSDQIDTSFRLLVALSDRFFPEDNYTWEQLTNPPKRPTGFGQSIKLEFNEPQHSLPQIGSLFQNEVAIEQCWNTSLN